MLHADQDGEKLQALLRLLTELMERVRVVDALSNVPQMYCLAVVEVVRRKMFMRHYREVGASNLLVTQCKDTETVAFFASPVSSFWCVYPPSKQRITAVILFFLYMF